MEHATTAVTVTVGNRVCSALLPSESPDDFKLSSASCTTSSPPPHPDCLSIDPALESSTSPHGSLIDFRTVLYVTRMKGHLFFIVPRAITFRLQRPYPCPHRNSGFLHSFLHSPLQTPIPSTTSATLLEKSRQSARRLVHTIGQAEQGSACQYKQNDAGDDVGCSG